MALRSYLAYLDQQKQNQTQLLQYAPTIETRINAFRDQWKVPLGQHEASIAKMIREETDSVTGEKSTLYQAIIGLSSVKDQLSLDLLKYMFVTFVISLILLHIAIRLFSERTTNIIFESNSLLNIFTVFVLVTSIVILAMSDKLGGKELPTLIGAISGYVLGSLGRSQSRTMPGGSRQEQPQPQGTPPGAPSSTSVGGTQQQQPQPATASAEQSSSSQTP